jgi:hypothetical protein
LESSDLEPAEQIGSSTAEQSLGAMRRRSTTSSAAMAQINRHSDNGMEKKKKIDPARKLRRAKL